MAETRLSIRLTGLTGFVKGKDFLIEPGETALIGRSSKCDIVIKEDEAERETESDNPNKGTAGRENHLKTVSRKHLRIEFDGPRKVFLEDLSQHGTFIDGKPLDGRDRLVALAKGPIELRLGTNEAFRMEFVKTRAKPKPKITVKRRSD